MLYEEYLRSSAIAGNSRSAGAAVRAGRDRGAAGAGRAADPAGVADGVAASATRQRDREQLLQRAIDASDRERRADRRRAARRRRPGAGRPLVPDGGGGRAATAAEPELRAALTEGAAGTRNAIRQLRSLLLEIYPPALRDQGLAAALPDLAAPLDGARHRGRAWTCRTTWPAHRGRAAGVPHRPGGAPERRRARRGASTSAIGVERSNGAGAAAGGRRRPRLRAGRRWPSGGRRATSGLAHAAGPGHVGRRHACR